MAIAKAKIREYRGAFEGVRAPAISSLAERTSPGSRTDHQPNLASEWQVSGQSRRALHAVRALRSPQRRMDLSYMMKTHRREHRTGDARHGIFQPVLALGRRLPVHVDLGRQPRLLTPTRLLKGKNMRRFAPQPVVMWS